MTDLLTGPATTGAAAPTPSRPGQRLGAHAHTALGAAAELLLGAGCHGCGAPAVGVCAECRTGIVRREPLPVLPQPCPDDFPLTVAASRYDPILRQLISAHKDRQAWLLTGILGDRLAVAVRAVLADLVDLGAHDPRGDLAGGDTLIPIAGPVVLVPVPSSTAAVRRRGRDSTLAIARRAARLLGPDVTAIGVLRQSRRLADQSGLNAAERAANVAGGFRVRARRAETLRGATVIVVDDLTTTGSSLLEADRALRRAGIAAAGAATVAVTERRHRSAGPVERR